MELYEKCLRVLEVAQNDTEKFGALLILQKTLKSDFVPQSFRKDVFRAIGSDFFSRMLHTEVVPEGCPPFIFKSVSFSLLAALLSDSDDLEIINVILHESDIAKQILITSPKFEEEEKMLEDVIYCLNAAISNDDARKKLVDVDITSIFIENVLLNGRHSKKILNLLPCLLTESPRETWLNSGQAMYKLLEILVNCLNATEAENFDIEDLVMIRKILETHPIGHLDPLKDIGSEMWLVSLRNGMFNIIKSKVFRAIKYRELVLSLAGCLTEKFGIAWLGLSSCNMAAKEARQFVAILVHVCSIEVCVLFDDCLRHSDKFSSLRHSTILSCYNVIDCIITVTSDHIWEMIHDYTKQILDSVNSTMAAIMNFLNELSVFWEDNKDDKLTYNFVIASIRLLCAWMAEETSALRNEICDVMPFIIDLTRTSIKNSNNQYGSELLKFILPPLCHLSVDNKTRRVLMRCNIASLLTDYLEVLWKDLKLTCPSTEKDDEKIATLCGILLNLVVMEGQTISEEETFFQLFKFLYTSLPQLSINNTYLILQANFSVLGLLIARQFYVRLRTCEVSFYKFLSSSIKFLWNAYDIRRENGRNSLVLTKDYYTLWGDLKELWFLGLQTLTSLFSMVPWIGQFLVTSGWPDHIISSLDNVDVNEIETSVKSAYQNFLCCLVKLCPDEFKSVQNILDVSAKHNMKELESLLLAVDISGSQDISVSI